MRKLVSLIFFTVFLALGGCASVQEPEAQTQMSNLLVPEPTPMNMRSQVAITRYNQILANAKLKESDRAQFYYQRGILYDSVGLAGMAQFDYSQALNLKPDMAEAFNSIGVHLVQQREFVQAYEAFDSTLEINPNYEFAFLNRGIALYYGGRPELALEDFSRFLAKDESDPFRVLWRYFAQHDVDHEEALANLAENRLALNNHHWATSLVDLFLGTIDEQTLLNNLIVGVTNEKQLTDRLCEAYFYLGKYHSERDNRGVASNYFKFALSTNVFEYVEHRYARLELDRLRQSSASMN